MRLIDCNGTFVNADKVEVIYCENHIKKGIKEWCIVLEIGKDREVTISGFANRAEAHGNFTDLTDWLMGLGEDKPFWSIKRLKNEEKENESN